jgi:cytochrome P450
MYFALLTATTTRQVFTDIIRKRRAAQEEHDDVLQILMNVEYKSGATMTDDEIGGLLIGVLFAGEQRVYCSGMCACFERCVQTM